MYGYMTEKFQKVTHSVPKNSAGFNSCNKCAGTIHVVALCSPHLDALFVLFYRKSPTVAIVKVLADHTKPLPVNDAGKKTVCCFG